MKQLQTIENLILVVGGCWCVCRPSRPDKPGLWDYTPTKLGEKSSELACQDICVAKFLMYDYCYPNRIDYNRV